MRPIFRRLIRNQVIGLVVLIGWGNLVRCIMEEMDRVTHGDNYGQMIQRAHRMLPPGIGAFDMQRAAECTQLSPLGAMWAHALVIVASLTIELVEWLMAWAS